MNTADQNQTVTVPVSRVSPIILILISMVWTSGICSDTKETSAFPLLEEVVVTAQRREQGLMKAPLAVTAFTGEELEGLGAIDISWLGQVTPNTSIEPARGTNNALAAYIRGVGQQDHIAGFEPGVGLYVDDVYFSRPQAALLDVYDVERIEILRGPQGTLYGRNTIGGAIKYITRRLQDTPEFKVRARAGSYGMHDAIVSGALPLGESVRVGGSLAIIGVALITIQRFPQKQPVT